MTTDWARYANPSVAQRDPRILTTFEKVTPESAEEGDVSDRGWIDEDGESMVPDEDTESVAETAMKFLLDKGATEPSSSHFHPEIWYTSYEVSENYRTGEVESRSYHLKDFTSEEEREVFALMKGSRR